MQRFRETNEGGSLRFALDGPLSSSFPNAAPQYDHLSLWSSKSVTCCIQMHWVWHLPHLKSCQWFAFCMHRHRWCWWVYCGASSGPSAWRVMTIVCRAPGFCACESCEWEICLCLLECTIVQGYAKSGWSWTGAEPAEMVQKYSEQAKLPTDQVLDETMLRIHWRLYGNHMHTHTHIYINI